MNHLIEMARPEVGLWVESLGRASVGGAVAIAMVWVIARWCTFLSPRIVCWMWRAVCLKLLIGLIWMGPVRIPILPPEPSAAVSAQQAASGVAHPVPVNDETMPAAGFPAFRPQVVESASGITTSEILAVLWSIGAVASIVVSLREWISLRRMRRNAAVVVDQNIQRMCMNEAARLGISRPPELWFSPNVNGPLLTGTVRPTIILPTNVATEFDLSDVRMMVAHELAHLRRHDLAWNWLPTMVGWIFFFHPLVWLLRRGWLESQERACDELLVQNRAADVSEFGSLLLKLATSFSRKPDSSLSAVGVLGDYRNLEGRILAMSRVKSFSRQGLMLSGTVIFMITFLAIMPWRLVAQEAAKGEKPKINGEFIPGPTIGAMKEPVPADNKAGTATADPNQLAGKIYAYADVDMTTEFGAPGKYRGIILIDPNTGVWAKLGNIGSSLRVSPDGTHLAFTQYKSSRVAKASQSDIFWADAEDPEPYRLVDDGSLPVWSPNGKRLLYHVGKMGTDVGWRGAAWTFDLETEKSEKLPVPETDEVDDWSQHGDWLVTVSDRQPPFGSGYQLYVMHPDGSSEKRITEGPGLNCYPRFSPEGKQITYTHQRHGVNSIWTVDTDGGNAKQMLVSDTENKEFVDGSCWSPDGKWLAVRKLTLQPEMIDGKKEWLHKIGESDERIEIVSSDGTARGVIKLKDVTKTNFLSICDWK
ncbi:MAG TPA: M56 family metallopeptidase [Pirellulales bacterium]|jgi:beta-lactamase regulating signal transducer with metallopeptidase domain